MLFRSGVARDVLAMRQRLREAKPAEGALEARNGPGRLMDIELFAQTVALWSGSPATGVEAQLAAGAGSVLSQTAMQAVADACRLLWQVQAGTRLLTGGPLDLMTLGEGGRAFLLRETAMPTAAALIAAVDMRAELANTVISRVLAERGATGPGMT